MAYIKKYNTGGPTTKPSFGKVYINGVDVTKNNQDAVDVIMSAFNDRKYVQDYLKSGNDVHITQNLDGSISFSGIPLDSSLKRRKQDREKEEVAKILFGVARNQNPREPGKNIGRLGEDINLEFSFENKGLENEVGTLLEGDNNFAALYRLKKIKDFYDNIDSFDEIEGWNETFGNDKAQVKEYIKQTFLDQNGNIKEELLNALKTGSKYNDFIKYKDIFDSINIIGKRDELTDEEKEAVQKEKEIQLAREKLGNFNFSSESKIELDKNGLPVFSQNSPIFGVIKELGIGNNYHLNLDFVRKYKDKLGNDPILNRITDNFENSLFYINGHVYTAKSLMSGDTNINVDDLKVFNDWVESNKTRPDISNKIQSYYTTENPYFILDDSKYFYPGLPIGGSGIYKIDNYYNVGDNDAILYRTNRGEMTYDKFGFPILEQGVFGSWSGDIDTNLFNEIFSKAKRLSTPQKWYYKKPLQFYKVGDSDNVKYYPVTLSEIYGGENNPVYELIYPHLGNKYVLYSSGNKPSLSFANIDKDGVFSMDHILGGEIVDVVPDKTLIARKSGGKIKKARRGLIFGINNNDLLHKPIQNDNNTITTKTSGVPFVDSLLDIVTSNYYKPEDYNILKIGTQGTPLSLIGEKLVDSAKHYQGKTRYIPFSTRKRSETRSAHVDIFKPEPLKPNWATPVLRSAQLISQLAGSKAAEKRMDKAIRESYTPKEQIQFTTPRFSTASHDQFVNSNKKALLDAKANTPLTSDPTKNMGYQQYWAQQRAAQIGKESALYSDMIDKYQSKNWELENKNRELAITTNNENNKALATMRSALHQNAAQGKLQRTGMWGQFFAGMQSEAEKARLYEENNWKLRQSDTITNNYLGQLRPISDQIDREYKAFKAKNPTTTLTKEEWLSQHNADLKAKRDDLIHNYRDMSSRIKTMTYNPMTGGYSMYDPSYMYYVPQTQLGEDEVSIRKKRGGKLSFIEKVSLEDKKGSNRNELERTKAMIKSMEKGNERLFKLILKILE